MKKILAILLISAVLFNAASAATETVSETEITDALPTDTGGADDLTNTFLNINVWLFSAALILLAVCTVGLIIYRIKKRRT